MKSAFSAALYSSVLSIVGTVHSVYMLLKSNKNKFVACTCLCVTLAAEGISDAFISDRVKTKKKTSTKHSGRQRVLDANLVCQGKKCPGLSF